MTAQYNEFIVINRVQAETYAQSTHKKTSTIISIYNRSDGPADIIPNMRSRVKSVFYTCFEDVSKFQPGAITPEQAADIAKFVYENSTDRLIVHCAAGTSRSAGACAAIMKILTGSDTQIFNDAKYRPNMHVYHTILNAMYEENERIKKS